MFAERHVRRGEADGATALVALLDNTFDLPAMAQKLGRLSHHAGTQRLSYTGRGIDLALAHHGVEDGDAQAPLLAHLAQLLDIAAAPRAEGEIVAAHDVAGAQAPQQNV